MTTRYLVVPNADGNDPRALATIHAAGSACCSVQAPELVLPASAVVADAAGRELLQVRELVFGTGYLVPGHAPGR